MGMVGGIKVGECESWAVDRVAGMEVCQLSLTGKVTKEEGGKDILRVRRRMGERKW